MSGSSSIDSIIEAFRALLEVLWQKESFAGYCQSKERVKELTGVSDDVAWWGIILSNHQIALNPGHPYYSELRVMLREILQAGLEPGDN